MQLPEAIRWAYGIGRTTAQILTARGDTVIGVDLREVEVSGDLSAPDGRVVAAEEATCLAGVTVDAVVACRHVHDDGSSGR